MAAARRGGRTHGNQEFFPHPSDTALASKMPELPLGKVRMAPPLRSGEQEGAASSESTYKTRIPGTGEEVSIPVTLAGKEILLIGGEAVGVPSAG